MRRREFIAVIGGAVAWPVVAWAQQARHVPTIGYVAPTDPLIPSRSTEVCGDDLRHVYFLVPIFYELNRAIQNSGAFVLAGQEKSHTNIELMGQEVCINCAQCGRKRNKGFALFLSWYQTQELPRIDHSPCSAEAAT